MNKQSLIFSLATLILTAPQAMAEPLRAVIGLNASQVIEDTHSSNTANHSTTLTPLAGTLLPLDNNFQHVSQPIQSSLPNWAKQIGHSVQVDNKNYALSYTGKLSSLDTQNQTFTLITKEKPVILPINDFYLLPLEKNKHIAQQNDAYQGRISYQSSQLAWEPKRSFIINQGNVSIVNMANIENTSAKTLQIQNSLLHYSHQQVPRFKTERNLVMMSAKANPKVNYADSEVTYPIQDITLPANSNTLMAISRETTKINSSKGVADVFTSSMSGEFTLQFNNIVSFTLDQSALPGSYNTYWQRDGLLIPGDQVSVTSARADQTLKISTNQSLDITGTLKLISATSKKLPSNQEWELTLKNLSNSKKQFSVTQHTHGVIANIKGNKTPLQNTVKKAANSVQFNGSLQPKESKTIRYTLELKE